MVPEILEMIQKKIGVGYIFISVIPYKPSRCLYNNLYMLTMQNAASKLPHGKHKLRTNSIIHRIQRLPWAPSVEERLRMWNKWHRKKRNRYSHSELSTGYGISISYTGENSEHARSTIKTDVDSSVLIFARYFSYGNSESPTAYFKFRWILTIRTWF